MCPGILKLLKVLRLHDRLLELHLSLKIIQDDSDQQVEQHHAGKNVEGEEKTWRCLKTASVAAACRLLDHAIMHHTIVTFARGDAEEQEHRHPKTVEIGVTIQVLTVLDIREDIHAEAGINEKEQQSNGRNVAYRWQRAY